MDRTGVRALLASVLFLIPACADGDEDVEQGDDAVTGTGTETAAADAPRAPLCTTATRFSLADASWMAWFSTQAYRHYRDFAPALVKAGFGNANDDARWIAEAARVSQARKDGAPNLAELEAGAIRTPHLDRKLDFFGDGAMEGTLFVHRSTQVTFAQHRTLPLAVITFRGTEVEHMGDVVTDMTSMKVETDVTNLPGRLHRGFFEGVESVAPLLFARIRALPPSSRIYVTGHSLGGALATVFTAELLREYGSTQNVSLYTFGSPRVGDAAFASSFEAKVAEAKASATRFHYERDPVVRVPFINYEHAGLPVFLERDRFALDSAATSGLPRVADHAMANYEGSLNRALSQKPAYPMTALGRAADVSLASLSSCSR
jgi:hypothetical protein